MKKNLLRALSMIMAVMMLATSVPMSAYADTPDPDTTPAVTNTTPDESETESVEEESSESEEESVSETETESVTESVTEDETETETADEPAPGATEGKLENRETVTSPALGAHVSAPVDAANGDDFYYRDETANATYGFYMVDAENRDVALTYIIPTDSGQAVSADLSGDYTIPATFTIDGTDYNIVQLGYEKSGGTVEKFGLGYVVNKLTIPASVTKIEAFSNDISQYVKKLEYKENTYITTLPVFGYFSSYNKSILEEVTLPNNITVIPDKAFWYCTKLTTINFPTSLESIGDLAFANTSLTDLDLTGCTSLESIGDAAFAWDGGGTVTVEDMRATGFSFDEEATIPGIQATSVKLPDSVKSVGDYAFSTCGFNYTGNGAPSIWHPQSGAGLYFDSLVGLTRYISFELGSGLESIGKCAFAYSQATSISIDSPIGTVGDGAFCYNYYLQEVNLNSTASAATIGDSAFEICPSLANVAITGGVKSIGKLAFSRNLDLVEVILPDSLETIGARAFEACYSLTKVRFPGIKIIGPGAFSGCRALSNIELPDGLQMIGATAFLDTKALKSVTIPSSVSMIGEGAFGNIIIENPSTKELDLRNSGIESLVIEQDSNSSNNAQLTIAPSAFAGCVGLNGKTIVLPERVSKLGGAAFLYIQNATFEIKNPELELINRNVIANDEQLRPIAYYEDGTGSLDCTLLKAGGVPREFAKYYTENPTQSGSYYQCEIPDPWSGSEYDTVQKYMKTPNGCKVVYPEELTRTTSPTFWGYIEAVTGTDGYFFDPSVNSNYTPLFLTANSDAQQYYPTFENTYVEIPYADNSRIVNGDYIFDVTTCDFIVTVKGGKEGDVSFGGGEERDKNNKVVKRGGILIVSTCKPVEIKMRDGVTSSVQRIAVSYSAHGVNDCAHITLNNVHIDRSNVVPYVLGNYKEYLDSEWIGNDGRGVYSAFAYMGYDSDYCSCTVTLVGENTLIGPDQGYCGMDNEECYGIYIQGGRGLGIKGTGSLKARGGDHGIKLKYGALRIEEGYYDIQDVVMDEKVKAIITGGYFAEGDVSRSQVYGMNICRDRYDKDNKLSMYGETYNNDDATKDQYPYYVSITQQAEDYLSRYIGRRTLYAMNEDYGRAYDTVLAAANDFSYGSSFDVSYHINNGFSMAETGLIKNAIVNDHPEFIWWWDAEWGGFSRGLTVNLTDPEASTPVALQRKNEKFDAAAKKMLMEAGITDEMSDYDKSYALYQTLISHVTYDLSQGDQSAYEAIVTGRAVCAGYAKAYVYLLQQAGIEATYVPGQAIPAGAAYSAGHAWVMLKLEGKYYHSDPTWDDGGSTSRYQYFNVPWSKLSSNHWIDGSDEFQYTFPTANSPQLTAPSETVTIKSTFGEGGKVYPTSLKIRKGSNVAVTIVPDDGEVISSVKVNNVETPVTDNGDGTYKIVLNNVTSNQNISASFSEKVIVVQKKEIGDLVVYKNNGEEMDEFDVSLATDSDGIPVLYVRTETPLTIEMKEGVESTPVIIQGMKPVINITLNNVHIDLSSYDAYIFGALWANNTSLNLTLKGNNSIKGNKYTSKSMTAVAAGNLYGWTNYSDGTLTIDGSGSLDIYDMKYGLEFTHGNLKGGKIAVHNVANPVGYYIYSYLGSELNITGGSYSDGNPRSRSIFGYTVANGCSVQATSDANYPYKVTGGSTTKVTSLSLDKTNASAYLDVEDDGTLILKTTVKPNNVSDPGLVWTTSNAAIATITDNGDGTATVNPVKAGTAKITVKATDGSGKSAVCNLNVMGAPITISGSDGDTHNYSRMASARDHILERFAADSEGTLTYGISVNNGIEAGDDELDYGIYSQRVSLNLNGQTIVVGGISTTPAEVYIALGSIDNGRFAVVSNTDVYTVSLDQAASDHPHTSISGVTFAPYDNKTTSANVYFDGLYENCSPTYTVGTQGLTVGTGVTTYIGNGIALPGGNVTVTDLSITEDNISISELTATGTVRIEEGASVNIDKLTMKSGQFVNSGNAIVKNVASIVKLDNAPGAYWESDTLTMVSTGMLCLEPTSTMHINDTAVIYSLCLGQDLTGKAVAMTDPMSPDTYLPASITRLSGTKLTVNTSFKYKNAVSDRLTVQTINAAGINPKTMGTTGDENKVLFYTNITKFPIEQIDLIQPEYITDPSDPGYVAGAKDYTCYDTLIQYGSEVVVATDWIMLYADDQLLITFMKWSDAVNYVNTISNPNVDYKLVLKEDVTSLENMVFPVKAKSFTLKGNDPSAPVTIKYVGDMKLSTDTRFENIILDPWKYDTKTKTYSENAASTISLNARKLELDNTYSKRGFAAVTGTAASTLVLKSYGNKMPGDRKMTLDVTNAISVGNLIVDNYVIRSEKNALTVSNDATLETADIDVNTNITIKNLHSLDGSNTMSYASTAKNALSISGSVDMGANPIPVTVTGITPNPSAWIDACAVSIDVKYINGAYIDNATKDLVKSAKAPASSFVIGRSQIGSSVQYVTKKVGNALRVETSGNLPVTLYSGFAAVLGNYETLQDALTDIDRYGDKQRQYWIRIDAEASKADDATDTKSTGKVTKDNANLTMPKNAGMVTITNKDGDTDKVWLYMNNTLTLNTDLVLENVEIKDKKVTNKGVETNTKLNINLGGNKLTLDDTEISDDRIGNITGNGVGVANVAKKANTSGLILEDDAGLTVTGNVNNAKTLDFGANTLTVNGAVNVGDVLSENGATLIATATIKAATDKKTGDVSIQSVNPNITVNGSVDGTLAVKLLVGGEELKDASFAGYVNKTDFMKSTNYHLMKAPNADPDTITYSGNDGGGKLIKNSGFICCSTAETTYMLYKEDDKLADFITFADAVTEINNRNDSSADYVITTQGNAANVAETFAMPAAKKCASLTIKGVDGTGNDAVATLTYGTVKNGVVSAAVSKFTLTSDTTFKNIIFTNGHAATQTPVTLAMGGKKLTLEKTKLTDRALLIDGGKTGALEIKGADGIIAGKNAGGATTNYIEGTIANLAILTLDPTESLALTDYVSAVNNKGVETLKPAALTVTGAATNNSPAGVVLNGNTISVCGTSGGSVSINDLSTEGTASTIKADRDLIIKGNVVLGAGLTLEGRQKSAKAGTPVQNVDSYISVNGTITGDEKITVKLHEFEINKTADIKIAEGTMVRLINAPKGTIQQFDTVNKKGETENAAKVLKLGNIIYAADDAAVRVVVVRTDTIPDTDVKSDIDGIPELVEDDFKVKLADYDGEGHLKDTAGLKEVNAFGYYPSFADAVTAINAVAIGKNDPKPQYSIILLDDVYDHNAAAKRLADPSDAITDADKEFCPVKLTFPNAGKSSRIAIVAKGQKRMFYNNALSLTSDVVMKDIVLVPATTKTVAKVKHATGAKLNIATGTYMLSFVNSNDVMGYVFVDTFDGEILPQIGNLTSGKTGGLRLIGTDLSIEGALNVATLELASGSILDVTGVKATTTATDIINDGGTLIANRGALTINGTVSGDALSVGINTGYEKAGFDCLFGSADRAKNGTFPANKKLFTAAKLSTKDVDVAIDDYKGSVMGSENSGGGKTVKVQNDFYQIADELADNMVKMKVAGKDDSEADYLDVNSALVQITTWNDPNASYVITLENDIADVNVRDSVAHSAIVMPGDNKAGLITFTGGSMMYSGNITAYGGSVPDGDGTKNGGLIFDGVILEPVAAANDKSTGDPVAGAGNIALTRNKSDKTGNPVLVFNNMSVGDTYGGHIANISGTKAVTDVYTDSDLTITGNFSNVRNVTITGASVLAGGKAGAMGDLILKGTSPAYTSIGAVTVPNVVLDGVTSPALGTVSNGATNLFTISGGVVDADGKPAASSNVININTYRAKSKNKDAKNKTVAITYANCDDTALDFTYSLADSEYTGINLINAPKAWAGYFRCSDMNTDYVSYKVGTGVYSELYAGKEENWQAKVIWKDTDEYATYAHTYAEAIADITTYATARDYTIELLNTGTEGKTICTAGKPVASSLTKNAAEISARGAFTVPAIKAASSVTITSKAGEDITGTTNKYGDVIIEYTGNVTPSTNVTFDNVILNNGAVNSKTKAFVPAGKVNAAMTTGFDLTLNENVKIKTADGTIVPTKDNAKELVNIASGAKGVVTVKYNDGDVVNEVKLVGKNVVSNTSSDGLDKAVMIEHEGITTYVPTWDAVVSYINAIGDKTVEYNVTLMQNVGNDTAPVKFTLPAAAKKITIKDSYDDGRDYSIYMNGTSISAQTDIVLDDIGIFAYTGKTDKKTKVTTYTQASYSIAVGNNATLEMTGDIIGEEYLGISQITGGTLLLSTEDTSNPMTVTVDKVVNMRTLKMNNAKLITGNGALTASVGAELNGADITVNGNATLKNANMNNSVIAANNINMTGNTTMAGSTLDAGLSSTVGNGKLTMANVIFALYDDAAENPYNELIVKQDKNGTSMLTISGTVKTDELYDEETGIWSGLTADKRKIDVDGDSEHIKETTAAALIRLVYNNRSTESIVRGKTVQSNVVPYSGMVYATFSNPKNANSYVRKAEPAVGETDPGLFAGIYTDVTTSNNPESYGLTVVSDTKSKSKQVTCIK